jgi:hypothetical protein
MNALIGFALAELMALISWRLGRDQPEWGATVGMRILAPVLAVLGPIVAVVTLLS